VSTSSLTLVEVAERLHVHVDTVRSLIRSGELPAFNASANPRSLKPRYRVTADALAGFLARRSVHAAPRPTTRRRQPADYVRFV